MPQFRPSHLRLSLDAVSRTALLQGKITRSEYYEKRGTEYDDHPGDPQSLSRQTLEAVVLGSYRRDLIAAPQVAQLPGVSRSPPAAKSVLPE